MRSNPHIFASIAQIEHLSYLSCAGKNERMEHCVEKISGSRSWRWQCPVCHHSFLLPRDQQLGAAELISPRRQRLGQTHNCFYGVATVALTVAVALGLVEGWQVMLVTGLSVLVESSAGNA